jgi:hypothetical protein
VIYQQMPLRLAYIPETYSLGIPPQRRQANMRTTTWSAAISVDLDQAISTLQASQIGAANFIECPVFIECLSFPQMLFPDRNNLPVNQSRPPTKSGTSGSEKAFMSAATLNRCCPCGGGNGPVLGLGRSFYAFDYRALPGRFGTPPDFSTAALLSLPSLPMRATCTFEQLRKETTPARGVHALRPSLGAMPGAARHDS